MRIRYELDSPGDSQMPCPWSIAAGADAGPTAPAHGLTLYRVRYDGFDTEARVNALFGGEAEA